ncbi:hypothetical protein SeLEV6574_g08598 [Synchytrium endobioticum]|uniref:Uncharacterized protein n=1 Tax=Synchytrium endobioticum TaxID=286115 RepID=A0A507BZ77_9FUNG|nr:hypothetical protein SeLEV6574_g08598 [Synchytrium endobioticum]
MAYHPMRHYKELLLVLLVFWDPDSNLPCGQPSDTVGEWYKACPIEDDDEKRAISTSIKSSKSPQVI